MIDAHPHLASGPPCLTPYSASIKQPTTRTVSLGWKGNPTDPYGSAPGLGRPRADLVKSGAGHWEFSPVEKECIGLPTVRLVHPPRGAATAPPSRQGWSPRPPRFAARPPLVAPFAVASCSPPAASQRSSLSRFPCTSAVVFFAEIFLCVCQYLCENCAFCGVAPRHYPCRYNPPP